MPGAINIVYFHWHQLQPLWAVANIFLCFSLKEQNIKETQSASVRMCLVSFIEETKSKSEAKFLVYILVWVILIKLL